MAITYSVGQRLTADLLQELADYTANKPKVRLVAVATKNLPNGTSTAIDFGVGSEDPDTDSFHDETVNPSRVTPTQAGYYMVSGAVYFSAHTDYTNLQVEIALNGTPLAALSRQGPNTNAGARSVWIGPMSVLVNGTTDYIELRASQSNTSVSTYLTVASGSNSSVLEVNFDRPA